MFRFISFLIFAYLSPVNAQEATPKYFQLLKDELNAAYMDAANSFINAKTAEEAAKYISSPDREEFIAAYPELGKEFDLVDYRHIFTHNMNQYALIRNKANKGESPWFFMIWHEEMNEPKVDWKATYAHGGMSWEKFLKETPEIPIEMRVTVKLDNYYNYQFSDEEVWQCVSFYTNAVEEMLYAYIRRDNPKFRHLVSELSKKKTASITAKLAYPEGEKKKNQIELVEMLADTWFDTRK